MRQFIPFKQRVDPEKKPERSFRDIARAVGWFVTKVMRTSDNGFPDRFFARNHEQDRCPYCGRGRVVLMEWKKKGKPLSDIQEKRVAELREAGLEVYVVDNTRQGKRILGI